MLSVLVLTLDNMTIEVVSTPVGLYYRASIKQKGYVGSYTCKRRLEAIAVCYQNFTEYLFK